MSPLPLVRCERLEEQLNDLTELHQNEILNLKQELASMEEKIAYQSYERARDIQVSTVGQVEKQKAEKAEWWFPQAWGGGKRGTGEMSFKGTNSQLLDKYVLEI